MALKCPYLTKLTFTDVIKNSSSIWKKADYCPVMSSAVRMFSGFGKSDDIGTKLTTPNKNQDELKCPFISGSKNILVETNIDECKDVIDLAKKSKFLF